ncbi:peroxiredoxin [Candidatus Halocynthiibacter alkanivorans]|uniref:peroxiredoxin n=1 Tax=Candidatus Halocynthiibacter alkanivorans TaxID=2267619 RepID=UPI000DF2CEB8|nr:peroxiredoxin [Candidatus Halocynthiibacter alkanivorans]
MTIQTGDRIAPATLMQLGANGPETVALADKLAGRKVVLFALPGAFTRTCSAAHLPGFMRNRDAFLAKGVDEVICVSVNDPFVMAAWGEASGASNAGITMLADADGSFTAAMGMEFSAAATGLFGRSQRYAMLISDGVVKVLHAEAKRGVCDISSAETMLAAV